MLARVSLASFGGDLMLASSKFKLAEAVIYIMRRE